MTTMRMMKVRTLLMIIQMELLSGCEKLQLTLQSFNWTRVNISTKFSRTGHPWCLRLFNLAPESWSTTWPWRESTWLLKAPDQDAQQDWTWTTRNIITRGKPIKFLEMIQLKQPSLLDKLGEERKEERRPHNCPRSAKALPVYIKTDSYFQIVIVSSWLILNLNSDS